MAESNTRTQKIGKRERVWDLLPGSVELAKPGAHGLRMRWRKMSEGLWEK